MARPTPCQDWDLRALLTHLGDSLSALTEAVTGQAYGPVPGAAGTAAGARAARRPLPPALGQELLDLAPLLIAEVDRPARFAAPVPVPPLAPPGDRLIAYLGRKPPTKG